MVKRKWKQLVQSNQRSRKCEIDWRSSSYSAPAPPTGEVNQWLVTLRRELLVYSFGWSPIVSIACIHENMNSGKRIPTSDFDQDRLLSGRTPPKQHAKTMLCDDVLRWRFADDLPIKTLAFKSTTWSFLTNEVVKNCRWRSQPNPDGLAWQPNQYCWRDPAGAKAERDGALFARVMHYRIRLRRRFSFIGNPPDLSLIHISEPTRPY